MAVRTTGRTETSSGGDNNNNNNRSKRKNKPKVQEINGVLWQLDDNGNPIKKVRKKTKSSADCNDSAGLLPLPSSLLTSPNNNVGSPKQSKTTTATTTSSSSSSRPIVREIDGTLWQLDENGTPIKKLRRKGSRLDHPSDPFASAAASASRRQSAAQQMESHRRAKSQGPPVATSRGRKPSQDDIQTTTTKRVRGRSLDDGPSLYTPGEYIDDKGRKIIIEEDGNKIVFDKHGKRLRPKKKNQPLVGNGNNGLTGGPLPRMMSQQRQSSSHHHRYDFMSSSIRDVDDDDDGRANFDDVWGDKSTTGRDYRKVGRHESPTQQRNSSPTQRLYQGMSRPPHPGDDGIDLDPSVLNTLSHIQILARTGGGNSNTYGDGNNNGSLSNGNNIDNKVGDVHDTTTTSLELKQQIEEYGRENRELKMQLMTAQDEVRSLTQQNQKEKAKNVKATTEMLQLKADHQQASDEKRNLELNVKNLEARLQELQAELAKFESIPMNRRIGSNGGGGSGDGRNGSQNGGGGGGDHLISQISDLMAENDALLDKLEFEKASSGHELKKKEEKILFLSEEVKNLRAENDMLFRGEAEKDPLMGRLVTTKKELEDKLEKEKEEAKIRIEGLQEMIESLQNANSTLRKDLEKATLEIKDEDDEEIRRAKEMAQAVAQHGTRNAVRAKRASIQMTSATQQEATNLLQQKTFASFGLNTLTALATSAGRK